MQIKFQISLQAIFNNYLGVVLCYFIIAGILQVADRDTSLYVETKLLTRRSVAQQSNRSTQVKLCKIIRTFSDFIHKPRPCSTLFITHQRILNSKTHISIPPRIVSRRTYVSTGTTHHYLLIEVHKTSKTKLWVKIARSSIDTIATISSLALKLIFVLNGDESGSLAELDNDDISKVGIENGSGCQDGIFEAGGHCYREFCIQLCR